MSATLLIRDSNTGVFLWILENFQEHPIWRRFAYNCFLNSYSKEHWQAAVSVLTILLR